MNQTDTVFKLYHGNRDSMSKFNESVLPASYYIRGKKTG